MLQWLWEIFIGGIADMCGAKIPRTRDTELGPPSAEILVQAKCMCFPKASRQNGVATKFIDLLVRIVYYCGSLARIANIHTSECFLILLGSG